MHSIGSECTLLGLENKSLFFLNLDCLLTLYYSFPFAGCVYINTAYYCECLQMGCE